MSETLEKVLSYLGEKPKKAGAFLVTKVGKGGAVKESSNDRPVPFHTTVRKRAGKVSKADTKVQVKSFTVSKAVVSSSAVGRLAAKLAVNPERVLEVTSISERTFHRRQQDQKAFSEAESDRVLRVARVTQEAERVFGDSAKARRWLSSDSRILGAKPLDLLATDAGSRDVEFELVRIDHGDYT